MSCKTCGNYQKENSDSNSSCIFFVQTKTSFGQAEIKDHESLFDKNQTKDNDYNHDVFFAKQLVDKGNKNVNENFNESIN